MKKTLFIILFTVFLGHLFFRIYSYRNEYTTHYDANYWKSRYEKSQWVVSESKNPIGDDGLYAYVSWEYIHGFNPKLLNAEIPPLGKYIIGVSILIFQNQNIIAILVGVAVLIIFYFLSREVFRDNLLAFIPVVIFSMEPIFYSQLRAPYLDTIYLMFLLLTLLCASRKKYLLTFIFLGCFASVKYPLLSLLLFFTLFIWFCIFQKNIKLVRFFIYSLTSVVVFLLSYIVFFIYTFSIIDFFKLQKWILYFYFQGAKAPVGIVFPMIFTGTWYTWFSLPKKVDEWLFLWPISFILSIVSIIFLLITKSKSLITLQALWIIVYMVFLSITPVFPRYLLLLLPFLYNLSIWFLLVAYKKIITK